MAEVQGSKPVRHSANNLKWFLLRYFLFTGCLMVAAEGALWLLWPDYVDAEQRWLGFAAVFVLIGLGAGYFAAQRLQRELDALQLALRQMARGRFAERLKIGENHPLAELFGDFNQMAGTVEERIRFLQEQANESLTDRSEATEQAVLEERRRLARDLHDSVSQQLFALHMSASALPKIWRNGDGETIEPMLQQLIGMSHHAQKQLRGLIAQLRPLELEGRRLREALEHWFPDYCRHNGLQGQLDLQLPDDSLPEALEHQCFLIVQEGMANVVKHASASRVRLSLLDQGDLLMLAIVDDGKGFRSEEVGAGSYGLLTMRERALKLGGELDIRSKAGAGTEIHVRIPLFR